MKPDTYWIPPSLALPRTTQKLFFSDSLDFGVAWFFARRIGLLHKEATHLDNLIPDEEMTTLDYVADILSTSTLYSYARPKRKEEYKLPYVDRGAFRIYGLGRLDKYATAFSAEERSAKAFLVFQRVEGGWKLYPKTLYSRAYDATPARAISARAFKGLEKRWTKAFNALPEFAWTQTQKHAGMPTLFGCVPKTNCQYRNPGSWDVASHPFWTHARRALLAMAAFERVNFPDPPDRYYNTFHWTVYGIQGNNAHSAELDLKIELDYDGWRSSINTEEAKNPTQEQVKSLAKIKKALKVVLEKNAPDVPFFFDSIHPENASQYDAPSAVSVHTTSMIFPWFSDEYADEIVHTKTGHDALRHLSQLPSNWASDVIEALDAQNTPE